jgi:cellulose synthase/poly-beta-1,6-N-acetylglucosamine synthase-like glycosyltransferase
MFWCYQIGIKYGCPVEDVITGLLIKCRGWKSAYCYPKRSSFLGLAPTTLEQALVQYKRWGEGNLQIFLSEYNALLLGHGKLCFGHIMCYFTYGLWALTCLPTWLYVIIPSLSFLQGTSLFPKVGRMNYFTTVLNIVIRDLNSYSLWIFANKPD